MDDKPNNLSEQIKIHGEAIQKSMGDISETARQAIADINAGFHEAQRRVDEMQRLAEFAAGKPPKGMANQHLGIVHSGEYVYKGINSVECSLMRKNLARLRRSLDGDITHSSESVDATITINIPKGG